jgi:HK97 family phage portal protein
MFPRWNPPIEAQAWQGWPVEWATPSFGGFMGLDAIMSRLSIVWACLDLNASITSTMPIYTTNGTEVTESPRWVSNPEPELYASWPEFFKQLFIAYMMGEAVLWAIARDESTADMREPRGYPSRFAMLNPAFVNIELIDGRRRFSVGDVDITDDVLHIRYSSWPGDARGHGPLESAISNMIGAAALEQYTNDLARRGGIPWAVLTHPGNLRGDQARDLQTGFVQSRVAGAPAVLSGGITLQQLTLSPRDLALIELRNFDEARLAVLLGVPPVLVGISIEAGNLVYQNVSGIYDYHWRSSLKVKTAAIGAALSGWLLPMGQGVEFNRDEYVQPPFGERVAAYATMHGIVDPATGQRAMTVDEIRARERFDGHDTSAALSVTA